MNEVELKYALSRINDKPLTIGFCEAAKLANFLNACGVAEKYLKIREQRSKKLK